jgi:hypothetical protein
MKKNKKRMLDKMRERHSGAPTMTNMSEVESILESTDAGGLGGTYSRQHQVLKKSLKPRKGMDLGLRHMGKE